MIVYGLFRGWKKVDLWVYKNIPYAYLRRFYLPAVDYLKGTDYIMHVLPCYPQETLPHGNIRYNAGEVRLWDDTGPSIRRANVMTYSHELVHFIAHVKYRLRGEEIIAKKIDQTLHAHHGYGVYDAPVIKVDPLRIPLRILGRYEMIDYDWIERTALG